MKKTFAAMVIVGMLAVGVCVAAQLLIGSVTGRMNAMHDEVLLMAGSGDRDGARGLLGRMSLLWEEYEGLLETMAPHDALHEVTVLLAECGANLASGDTDDFIRSMALLREAVDHLSEEEALGMGNIL